MAGCVAPGSKAFKTVIAMPDVRSSLRINWVYAAVPAVFLTDLWSKQWAEGLFGGVRTLVPGLIAIRLLHNPNGPFGFLAGLEWGAWPVGLISLAMIGVLAFFAVKTRRTKKMRHLGFACMIGGAMGNAWDRWTRGYVVDFIELWFFPVFNVADLALWAGLILVGVDFLFVKKPES